MSTQPAMCALAALADRADSELAGASALEVMRWAADTFGDRLCVASSMSDAALLHLAARALPGIDVLFLDTGYHFAATLAARDAFASAYDITVVDVRPSLSVVGQDAAYGPDLFARDPDLCCATRKVAPLARALEPYDAWVAGVRRSDSANRANTRVVSWDGARGLVKVCPIAAWTQADVDAYVAEHGLLTHGLRDEGYRSIGCAPCTRLTSDDEDPRAGRWSGFAKTECGIHG